MRRREWTPACPISVILGAPYLEYCGQQKNLGGGRVGGIGVKIEKRDDNSNGPRRRRGQEGGLVKKAELSPVSLDSIIFAVPGSTASISALIDAARAGVDVVLMDNWRPVARLVPARYGFFLRLWHAQLRTYMSKKRRASIAAEVAGAKIWNQRINLIYMSKLSVKDKYSLRRLADEVGKIVDSLSSITTAEEAMQAEAEAARLYWRGG